MRWRNVLSASLVIVVITAAVGRSQSRPASRPTPPARDPHSSGFVDAATLPDRAVPSADQNGNFIVGPTRVNNVVEKADIAHGSIVEFTMESKESKIYPGIARESDTSGTPDPNDPAKLIVTTSHAAPWSRKVTVQIPANLSSTTKLPFIVSADGYGKELFIALDNLIAEHRVPPMVAIAIGNGGGDAQGSQRGLEYDTMSGRYAEFVETEVLPRVESQGHVTLTHDPDGRATMGCSSGASCALIMAWYRPDLYRRVLSFSGTFVNQQWPANAETPHGAWEFHERLISQSDAKPLRIWMEVGDKDLLNPNAMRDGMHDWVLANERMATVLAEKKYSYQFVFCQNATHCDGAMKKQLLPEALEYVWKGYASKAH